MSQSLQNVRMLKTVSELRNDLFQIEKRIEALRESIRIAEPKNASSISGREKPPCIWASAPQSCAVGEPDGPRAVLRMPDSGAWWYIRSAALMSTCGCE